MNLLIYHDPNDVITRELLNDKLGFVDRTISVEQLLNEVRIFDTIEKGVPTLEWTMPDGSVITNSPEVFLVNRVLGLSQKLFSSFIEEDQEYAFQEFYAYLTFALEAFPCKTAAPGPFGLASNQFPLPYQWKRVGESLSQLQVPEFIFGTTLKKTQPKSLQKRWVRGNLYSHYHWNPDTPMIEGNLWYQRPQGEPVVVLRVGREYQAFSPGSSRALEPAIKNRVLDLAPHVFSTLQLSLGEALFFVDSDKVCFAMVSPLMRSASLLENFSAFMKMGLKTWQH